MRIPALLSLVALALALASPAMAKSVKIGLVTDVGGLNDQGFNSLAYKGLKRAKDQLKVRTNVIESHQATDYEKNLAQFASGGYDLVISVGFMMGDATKKVAARFPNTKFAIVDFNYPSKIANVKGITFAEEQAGYLAGALAALESKSGKIGFVGGMDVPVIHRFKLGYEAGAKASNPKIKIVSGYTGSFTDSAKGREVATAQFQQGVDIAFQAAGASGLGVIDAAKASRKMAIGVDADQNYIAPDFVLSSALKNVDMAVFKVVEETVTGKFVGGNQKLTFKDGAVGLAPFYEDDAKISASTKKQLDAIKAKLAAGKISVNLGKDVQ